MGVSIDNYPSPPSTRSSVSSRASSPMSMDLFADCPSSSQCPGLASSSFSRHNNTSRHTIQQPTPTSTPTFAPEMPDEPLNLLANYENIPIRLGHMEDGVSVCRLCAHVANPTLTAPSKTPASLKYLTRPSQALSAQRPPSSSFFSFSSSTSSKPKSPTSLRTILYHQPASSSPPLSSHPSLPASLTSLQTQPIRDSTLLPYRRACPCPPSFCDTLRTTYFPPRLIEISRLTGTWSPGNGLAVRIVDACVANRGNYLILSYCPGKYGFEKNEGRIFQGSETTKETEARNRQEVPWWGLPRGWRTAFTVAIGLGFKYIWVDRLCAVGKEDIAKVIKHSMGVIVAADLEAIGRGDDIVDIDDEDEEYIESEIERERRRMAMPRSGGEDSVIIASALDVMASLHKSSEGNDALARAVLSLQAQPEAAEESAGDDTETEMESDYRVDSGCMELGCGYGGEKSGVMSKEIYRVGRKKWCWAGGRVVEEL